LVLQRQSNLDLFNEFAKAKSDLKTTYIGLGCDMKGGPHNIQMSFNKEALLDGIEIFANIINEVLG